MMSYEGPLPDATDATSSGFWAAARCGRLAVQRCDQCGSLRWQPAPICPECLCAGGTWVDLSGCGTVWSFADYHRAMHPAYVPYVPYTVVLVELDEHIRMVGAMYSHEERPFIDARVKAVFEPVTDEVTLVRWALDI